jgi:hypothetical protein
LDSIRRFSDGLRISAWQNRKAAIVKLSKNRVKRWIKQPKSSDRVGNSRARIRPSQATVPGGATTAFLAMVYKAKLDMQSEKM